MFGSDNQKTNTKPAQSDDPALDGALAALSGSPRAFGATSTNDSTSEPPVEEVTAPPVPKEAPVHDDLMTIKQQALQDLSPLVDHLDQTPEEKFRTTMMMIQASDDQSMIKVAYEAAKNIADEKTKAQALLDIVNEINYFTQQSAGTEKA